MPRLQVLLAEMPALVDDLVREALAGADVELLPPGSTTDSLRPVDDDESPPVLIMMADATTATQLELELLRPRPEVVIVRIEDDGRLLALRTVEVQRRRWPGVFTEDALIAAIESAPSWRDRFA